MAGWRDAGSCGALRGGATVRACTSSLLEDSQDVAIEIVALSLSYKGRVGGRRLGRAAV